MILVTDSKAMSHAVNTTPQRIHQQPLRLPRFFCNLSTVPQSRITSDLPEYSQQTSVMVVQAEAVVVHAPGKTELVSAMEAGVMMVEENLVQREKVNVKPQGSWLEVP